MVLWFEAVDGEPLYSFDVRGRNFEHAKLWSSNVFGDRAKFRAKAGQGPAQLVLDGVTAEDEGVYRCRVDFKNSPTRNMKVNLTVIVRPLETRIMNKERLLSVDRRYEVECRSAGSRPEPVITWWKGNRQMKKLAKNFSADGNHSISVLSFQPAIDDDGKYLTCRAENPAIPDSALEDRWRLEVQYPPVVTLRMGASLNPNDIKEGDDVYFECNVRANPKAYRLAWYHAGREMQHNISAGIILSDQSLVLQGVSRQSAGDYACMAANGEGKGSSNLVALNVMYAPTCRSVREELHGAGRHDTVTLRCEVDAHPAAVAFHWTFNNSGESSEVPAARFSSQGATSTLNYTPANDMDFGTLACWGENAVGRQRTPCVFQVISAGRPFPPSNCSLTNHTSEWVRVECLESFDGGLPQGFQLELLELPYLVPKYNVNVTRGPPVIEWQGSLEQSSAYQVRVYAINAKGRSDPVVLQELRFKGVAKYTDATRLAPPSHLLAVALAPMDDTDPDVIPSIYERRPLKHQAFATLNCRTPQQRRRKKDGELYDEDDAAFDELQAKSSRLTSLTPLTAMATLSRAGRERGSVSHSALSALGCRPSESLRDLPMDACCRGPPTNMAFAKEVSLCTSPSRPLSINNIVTTSHKIQESCI
ncbi:hypothetical protein ONE63_009349 [Megalurothrips usitatus]|uniref:Uncharacterized protein n=1 Tax=Megalurothrips usitatus TaxID=439358 RepID=A0AAV7XKT0_9NEOP|nr:hypothetical protein ONE63_009349 [Megalurothrips usitatus]